MLKQKGQRQGISLFQTVLNHPLQLLTNTILHASQIHKLPQQTVTKPNKNTMSRINEQGFEYGMSTYADDVLC